MTLGLVAQVALAGTRELAQRSCPEIVSGVAAPLGVSSSRMATKRRAKVSLP